MQTISFLPGAIEIFGHAWTLYKQRFGIFLGVQVIPVSVSVLLSNGGPLYVYLLSKFPAESEGAAMLFETLCAIIFTLSTVWGGTALLYAIKDAQERIGIIESYRRSWDKTGSYLWVSFLTASIILGGFPFLAIPGIIFAVWFSLSGFILIAEDVKGMNAMLKSREYVKGRWGGVFWRLFFICMGLLIPSSVLIIISHLLFPFGTEISQFLISSFLIPLLLVYVFWIYRDLKALKGEVACASTWKQSAALSFFVFIGLSVFLAVFLKSSF